MINKQTISLAKEGIELSKQLAELYGVKSILQIKKINIKSFKPNELGVCLSDGSINFQTTESAINYARSRIVDALNQQNPFERSIQINGTRVLREIDGNQTGVWNGCHDDYNIAAHGHPDIYGKGLTTAPSSNDFEVLTGKKMQEKEIVFNSKGEYYIMEKKPNAKMHTFELEDDYFQFMAEKFAPKKLQEKINDIITEGYDIITQSDAGENLVNIVQKKVAHVKPSVRKQVCDATHEFWEKFKDKYEVKTQTNFSNFS